MLGAAVASFQLQVIVEVETASVLQAYAVILCATWRNAQNVFDQCVRLVSRRRDRESTRLTPLLMFGASGDLDVEVIIGFSSVTFVSY